MGRVSNELSYQSEETTRTQVGSLDTLFGGGVGGGLFKIGRGCYMMKAGRKPSQWENTTVHLIGKSLRLDMSHAVAQGHKGLPDNIQSTVSRDGDEETFLQQVNTESTQSLG